MIPLALFQPEIPQNVGTLMRLAACLGIPLNLIEPLGFVWTDRHFKRSAMDYRDVCSYERFPDWSSFQKSAENKGRRVVLVTPHQACSVWDFSFTLRDILVMGRESTGFPDTIMAEPFPRVVIPMMPGRRSLNVAIAASLALGEALRQTGYMHTLVQTLGKES